MANSRVNRIIPTMIKPKTKSLRSIGSRIADLSIGRCPGRYLRPHARQVIYTLRLPMNPDHKLKPRFSACNWEDPHLQRSALRSSVTLTAMGICAIVPHSLQNCAPWTLATPQ